MNTNPIPRVPPVTRAVMPWSDHLLSFMLLNFASPIFVSNQWFPEMERQWCEA